MHVSRRAVETVGILKMWLFVNGLSMVYRVTNQDPVMPLFGNKYDDVIKWKHFPRYWPFVWGIHRWPVNSPHKGQWRGALVFSMICAWINGWVNNRGAGDLRHHRPHYDVTLMFGNQLVCVMVCRIEVIAQNNADSLSMKLKFESRCKKNRSGKCISKCRVKMSASWVRIDHSQIALQWRQKFAGVICLLHSCEANTSAVNCPQ